MGRCSQLTRLLAILLFAYSLFVGLPHALIGPHAFATRHVPHWYWWDEPMHTAMAEATQPDTTISVLCTPFQGQCLGLWNEDWTNRVLKLERGTWMDHLDEIDYVVLRPEHDSVPISWADRNPWTFRLLHEDDRWGRIYEVGDPPPEVIVMICLDACREDRVRPHIMPNLCDLAEEGTYYENAYCSGFWTLSSIGSVFTGKWPSEIPCMWPGQGLPEHEVTLAERLQALGWVTVGLSANMVVREQTGFSQGFVDWMQPHSPPWYDAEYMISTALEMIQDVEPPLFLYIHLMDTHMPLDPPETYRLLYGRGEGRFSEFAHSRRRILEMEPTDSEVEQIRGLYDAEAAYADHEIMRLFQQLRSRGLWDRAMIVFFSDHGEQLGEHGDWDHGYDWHDEMVHVPLIVKMPGQESEIDSQLFSLVDLGELVLNELDRTEFCLIEGAIRDYQEQRVIIGERQMMVWKEGAAEPAEVSLEDLEALRSLGYLE